MRKLKLFMTALALAGGMNCAFAQTDVTSTYLTNADFSQTTALDNGLCGYGKDMSGKGTTYYGLQAIDGWTSVVVSGDNSNATYPNSGMGGAVFAYGSDYLMMGNNTKAPSADPDGNAGNCLGFFGVWGCGGYYYQEVTLAAGKYTINIPAYNQSGTQANTSYIGWIPNSGTSYTLATNPTVGSWTTLTATFTLTDATTGKICLGYKSTGSGSSDNAMLYFDKVQILYTAVVVKDILETALTAATNANATLSNSDLTSAIATAQAVYDDDNATQDEVNSAAATLNAAVELAMSAAGNASFLIPNLGFESCTVTTTNAAAGGNAAPLDIAGNWTQTASAAWSSSAVVQYDGSGQVNGASAPSKDNADNSGNTLGISVGWSGTVTYKSAAATLPAGVYTIKVNAYNAHSKTQFKSLFGFVPTTGTATLSTKTSFASGAWETDEVTFTLNEATEGCIQVGGQAVSGGSGDNAKVFFDNITIGYQSFLAGAKQAWDEAVAAAEQAKTDCPNVTGEELTALNAELAKAEPTTVEGYNEATDALTAATDALVTAATSYNALVTVNDLITAAGTLEYADADKKPSADVTATSASDADTKAASQYTALRAYYESHAMAENVDGAVDMTSAITNAANPSNTDGWTLSNTVGNSNMRTMTNEPWTNSDGTTPSSYFDSNSWGSAFSTTMTQEVTLEAGKYLLSVMARGNGTTTYQLTAKEEATDIEAIGNSGGVFGRGWNSYTVEFEVTEDEASATIGMNMVTGSSANWLSFGDFKLVQLSKTEVPMAGETEYAALNAAIESAEAHTLGFIDNEYAPYNNVDALEALATAKAFDTSVENRKKLVEAATSALNDATWTANDGDVDAIFNGTFAETGTGNNPKGWTRSNNGWGQQITGLTTEANGVAEGTTTAWYYNNNGAWQYGNDGVYTMPLAANTKYVLTFKYSKHGGDTNNWMKASVLNESNEGLDVVQYPGASDNTVYQSASAYFTTGEAGNYILSLEQNGNVHLTDVSLVKAESTEYALSEEAEAAPAEMAYYETVTLTRTLSASYWNTFSVPFDMDIPEDWTVKEFDSATDNTLNFKEATTIEAGVPYLVKPTETVTNPTFEGVLVKATEGETMGTGEYKFAAQIYNKSLATNGTIAYLATDGYIKKLTSGSLKGLRAYFIIPSGANARITFIDDGGTTTGIESMASDVQKVENGAYDLQGRRVEAMKKGLYIVNGKKVVK